MDFGSLFNQFINEAQLLFIQWIAGPFIDDQEVIVCQFFQEFLSLQRGLYAVVVQEHVLHSVEKSSFALQARRFPKYLVLTMLLKDNPLKYPSGIDLTSILLAI